MKKGDKLLFFFLTIILVITLLQFIRPNTTYKTIVIRADGHIVKKIPLSTSKNEEFALKSEEGHLTVQIQNGKVRVKSSTCKDKLCVKQGWINKSGESIVCLPNRISISIIGEKDKNGVNTITY